VIHIFSHHRSHKPHNQSGKTDFPKKRDIFLTLMGKSPPFKRTLSEEVVPFIHILGDFYGIIDPPDPQHRKSVFLRKTDLDIRGIDAYQEFDALFRNG